MSKRRFFKKRRKSGLTVKKLDKKIKKLAKKIEVKEKSSLITLQLTGGTDTDFPLNELARGTATGQRVGDQVHMKRLMMTIQLLIPQLDLEGTDTTTAWNLEYKQDSMRVILLIDKQNNNSDAAPVISTILENAGNQAQKIKSQYDYMFVNGPYNRRRYKILYDRVHVLSQFGPQEKFIRINKSLNHKVNFSTDNGNGTDIVDNKIVIIFIPEGNQIEVAYSSVIFYTDA